MKNLNSFEQKILTVLKNLQIFYQKMDLYTDNINTKRGVPYTFGEFFPPVVGKEELRDVVQYLKKNGLEISITYPIDDDNFDNTEESTKLKAVGLEKDIPLGLIKGENIEAIKTVIKENINKLKGLSNTVKRVKETELGRINGENLKGITSAIKGLTQELTQKAERREGDDNIFIKNRRKITLPRFKSTEWAKVTIRFIDKYHVYITADKKTVTVNYEGLGFCNDKNRKPNTAWSLLFGIAENGGETSEIRSPIPGKIKAQKSVLSNQLKKIFQNDTDPFYDFSETKTYKAKMVLIPPIIEEEHDSLGIQEYLNESSK